MNQSIKKIARQQMRLYAVTDRHWLNGRSLETVVEEALQGGVTILQLREKELSREAFIEEAKRIGALAKSYGVLFIINDDVEVAKAVDADGVHIGQDDMSVAEVRDILGGEKIIGVSAHNVEEAKKAEADGADYIGCGAFHSTSTKLNTQHVTKETYQAIAEAITIPMVAIGGISKENLPELEGYNVDGAALVSAIFAADDITQTCKELKEMVERVVR